MAYNIFERWPWTSFQNLNLDWILRKMKEAVEKATEASESVGSFDDRITKNSKDIAQLLLDVENIARPLRIFVNSNLEVLHAAYPMTGGQIYDLIAGKEYIPFIEYLNEYYMPADIQTNALVFQKLHIPTIGNPYIKILTIPLTESRAGYTIKEWTGGGGGGGSDDIRIVKITARNDGYTSDTAYAQIVAAMNAGQHIAMQLLSGGNVLWETATVFLYGNNNQYIAFTNPRSFMDGSGQMYGIIIDSSNNVKNLIGSNYITADSFLTNYLPRLLPVVSATDNGKFLRVVEGVWEAQSESFQTQAVKQALLNCFENVAWINDQGQTYYDTLYAALYPPADVLSISAVFTQGEAVIYDTDDLDTLKQHLVVTATMTDSTTQTVTNYTLSGTLTVGTSTITVSYGGKTTTFTVTVTEAPAQEELWINTLGANDSNANYAFAPFVLSASTYDYNYAKAITAIELNFIKSGSVSVGYYNGNPVTDSAYDQSKVYVHETLSVSGSGVNKLTLATPMTIPSGAILLIGIGTDTATFTYGGTKTSGFWYKGNQGAFIEQNKTLGINVYRQ